MTPAESEQLRAELAGTEYSVPEPNVRFQNRIFGSSCSLGGRASRGVPGAGKLPIMLSWVHGIRLNACVGCTRCPINYGPINSWNRIFGSGTEHSVLGPNIRFRRAPGDPWSVPTASRWSLRKSGVSYGRSTMLSRCSRRLFDCFSSKSERNCQISRAPRSPLHWLQSISALKIIIYAYFRYKMSARN